MKFTMNPVETLLVHSTDTDGLVRAIAAALLPEVENLLKRHLDQAKLVDINRLERLTDLSGSTINRLVAKNEIPSVRVGTRRLFDPDAVVRALKDQSEKGGQADD